MSGKPELTRAEIARQRRAQRAAKEMEQTTKRAVKPMVSVTSRTPTIPVSSKPRFVVKPRRFNIALGLPEFHLHRPKFIMPRLHANWRLASIIISLLLGVAIYLAFSLPYFFVPSATVLGNLRITREEITAVLGVTGQSIFTVQPDELETRLRMNYPELLSADVEVYLPNHVYVTVKERTPVIIWQQGEGYTWIDTTGVAFRPRGLEAGLVPVVAVGDPLPGIAPKDDLLSPPPYMQKELVDAILALSPLLPASTTMTFDPAQGLGWTDPRGWKTVFGTSAHDMPLKARVYQSLVDSLMARSLTPIYINVVYPDAPYYRLAVIETEDSVEEETVDSGQ
ncbi:MAG: FtsQ-type POTRA domain-containing protein [Anaerolineales bacterium]|nr:FtsQ-type POTRA domain-containing protein [Anaerolineales bacterium]